MRPVLLASLFMPGVASATDLTVGVSTGCATIQACINSAANNDNILIPVGTYTETLTFSNKPLVLKRAASSGNVILTGSGGSTIASLSTGNIQFLDIIFDGAAARTCVYGNNGGAHRLERVTMRNCRGNYGGGLHLDNGSLTVVDSTFSGNSVVSNGQGAALYTVSAVLNVSGSTFDGNTSPGSSYGGAIEVSYGSLVMTTSTLRNNTGYNGGALSVFQATSAFQSRTFNLTDGEPTRVFGARTHRTAAGAAALPVSVSEFGAPVAPQILLES